MTGSRIPGLEPNEATQTPGCVTWEEKSWGLHPARVVLCPSPQALGTPVLSESCWDAGGNDASGRDAPPPTPPPIPSMVHQAEGDGCRKDQVSGQTDLLPPAWQPWVSRHLSRAHPIPALLALLWVCPAPPAPPPSPESNPPRPRSLSLPIPQFQFMLFRTGSSHRLNSAPAHASPLPPASV